ncbi:hypothetical protein PIB30_061532 [Stylosanthes scabra]|uniref:Uncharacterized protein n=1 Tax=Stylosanthes scabra TaxID=79078 RepID=A0ABU6ZJJ7_9FABA|nr:hypothetical protein [Stylosanthes scabra]
MIQDQQTNFQSFRKEIDDLKARLPPQSSPNPSPIPSQTIPNHKGGINSITLRSGTTIQGNLKSAMPEESDEEVEETIVDDQPQVEIDKEEMVESNAEDKITKDNTPTPPFPQKAQKAKKEKLKDVEVVPLGGKISYLIQNLEIPFGLPEKLGDFGPFFVSCMLADLSITKAVGVAKDVLLRIKDLVFLVDFYVMEMASDTAAKPSTILIGRPFLRTSHFMLNHFSG